MAYSALVTRIHTRPVEGLDNLVLGTCAGYQVLVGKDTEDGALGCFFESGGQLDQAFCEAHDLIRRKNLDTGAAEGGYFEENRRVKALKLRGIKSEGFWVPLWYFDYLGLGKDLPYMVEGFTFTELEGSPICCRYETPATRRAMAQGKKAPRGETKWFRKQPDIEQFRRASGLIPAGSVIYITEKLHGTSHRVGLALEEQPLTWWQKFIDRWGIAYVHPKRVWQKLDGSKNVILNNPEGRVSYYGSDDFRHRMTEGLDLRKGETVYGEIVGWHTADGLIMGAQDTKGLKEVAKQYGPKMVYAYGCTPGTCEFWVYRITMTNEDGQVEELSFPRVQQRTGELGLKCVPLLYTCYYGDSTFPAFEGTETGRERLSAFVEAIVNGAGMDAHPSTVDPSHIREGAVVRYESEHGTGWLKHKSFVFGTLEGYIKSNDEYVDLEEIS